MNKPTVNIANKPAFEFRSGKVRAAVWENKMEDGTVLSLTLNRTYKEGNQWRNSSSFPQEDLTDLCTVLSEAIHWMSEAEGVSKEGEAQEANHAVDGKMNGLNVNL